MTQGRSYVAGLVTGVVVAGAVTFVSLRATAAPGAAVVAVAPAAQAGAKMPEPAVKVLLDTYAPDSGGARRFVDEARITGQLQHPGADAGRHHPPAGGTQVDRRQVHDHQTWTRSATACATRAIASSIGTPLS